MYQNNKISYLSLRSTAGLSVLEVAFTLMIMSLLVVVSIPFYQEYIAKTQAKEGVNMLLAAGAGVGIMKDQLTCLPSGKTQLMQGKYGVLETTGTYTELDGIACKTSCQVKYTFNDKASGLLVGKTILGDILNDGTVSFLADDSTLDEEFQTINLKAVETSNDNCQEVVHAEDAVADSTAGATLDVSTLPPPVNEPYEFITREYDPAIDGTTGFPIPALVDLSQPLTLDFTYDGYGRLKSSLVKPINHSQWIFLSNPNPYDKIILSDDSILLIGGVKSSIYRTTDNHVYRSQWLHFKSLPSQIYNAYPSVTIRKYQATKPVLINLATRVLVDEITLIRDKKRWASTGEGAYVKLSDLGVVDTDVEDEDLIGAVWGEGPKNTSYGTYPNRYNKGDFISFTFNK